MFLTLSACHLAGQSLIERSEVTLLDSPLGEYFVPRSLRVIEWGWIASTIWKVGAVGELDSEGGSRHAGRASKTSVQPIHNTSSSTPPNLGRISSNKNTGC